MEQDVDINHIFVVNLPLLEKKLIPGIFRDGDQFCLIIPGYGKALKIINHNWDPYYLCYSLMIC